MYMELRTVKIHLLGGIYIYYARKVMNDRYCTRDLKKLKLIFED
jgi:hypothetical protein